MKFLSLIFKFISPIALTVATKAETYQCHGVAGCKASITINGVHRVVNFRRGDIVNTDTGWVINPRTPWVKVRGSDVSLNLPAGTALALIGAPLELVQINNHFAIFQAYNPLTQTPYLVSRQTYVLWP